MQNKLITVLVLLLVFVSCKPNQEQVETLKLGGKDFSLSFEKPKTSLRSSDLLKLQIVVEHKYNTKLKFESSTEDYGSFELLSQEITSLGVSSPDLIRSKILVVFEPGLPGKHLLPALKIATFKGRIKNELIIPASSFDVLSVLPSENTEIQAIETSIDGEPISSKLRILLMSAVIVMLIVGASYVFIKDRLHETAVVSDDSILRDLAKGVKDFSGLETMICRFIGVQYSINLAPLASMLEQATISEELQSLIEAIDKARFSPAEVEVAAFVESFTSLVKDSGLGGQV